MRRLLTCLLLCASMLLWGADAPQQDQAFTVLGIGGAGGMYTPTACPTDPNFMLLSCDMSGCYRSIDGGRHWEMIHYAQICGASTGSRPCFINDSVYWSQGPGLKVSTDKGKTWQTVGTGSPWGKSITQIAASATTPVTLFVGNAESGLWTSLDGGQNWKQTASGKCGGIVTAGAVFAAIDSKLLMSTDNGQKWTESEVADAKGKALIALAGGTQNAATVLLAIAESIGTLASADLGKTWKLVLENKGQNDILMPPAQTQIAYASSRKDIWRTRDGAQTWEECLHYTGPKKNVDLAWVQTQLHWGYSISPKGLGINPAVPQTVFVSTQGDFYVSQNSGDSWKQLINEPVGVKPGDPEPRFKCTGLEVTSAWQYVFDPFERQRRYVAFTDIGFIRTVDSDETWIHATKGSPWGNTFYVCLPDPFVKGRLYAACSNRHDIPHWTHVTANDPKSKNHVGGVCVSDDFGLNWKVLGKGLPNLPCRYLCIDPKSTAGKLTMYAAVFGDGVYKSVDSGQSWVKKSKGLGHEGNNHALMVQIHPKTGDLYCSITAHRKDLNFAIPGGLWKSADGGENWTQLNQSRELHWPNGFAVHPEQPETMYLTAATIPGKSEGGLYKSSDGGKSWQHLVTDKDLARSGGGGFSHCFWVKLHPDNPDHVYLSTGTHGLWLSTDAGTSWKRFDKLPFGSISEITFDPQDHSTIYVSSFGGGVWKGKSQP